MAANGTPGPGRCPWAESSEAMRAYHDDEWGVPTHDDRRLFELLTLEGAQAGLSWSTILNKRARYREVFAGFDPAAVAGFGEANIATLLDDPGIVRNRLKVRGTVTNARAVLAVQREHGSLDAFLWSWVDGRTLVNHPRTMAGVPARTERSDRLSKDLKRLGFTFVGSTIIYSFLQAAGMVDDHLETCPAKAGAPG